MKPSQLLVFSLLVAPVLGGCGLDFLDPPPDETPDAGTADAGTPDAGSEEPPPIPDGGTPTPGACNADTCSNGCCIAGSCYRTNSDYACGSLGGQCSRCQVPQTCQREDVFRGWECLLEANAQWTLQPKEAKIPPTKPNGDHWDTDKSPPEVILTLDCPKDGKVTQVKTKEVSSFTPTFTQGNCTTTAAELLKAAIHIKMVDMDFLGFTDDILVTDHTLTEEDLRKGTSLVPITPDGTYHLTLQLTRVP